MTTAASTAHFALTKRLWNDVAPWKWQGHNIWDTFPDVQHFCGIPPFLRQTKRACRFTVRGLFWQEDWSALFSLRHVTHLRMAMDLYYGVPDALVVLPVDTALRVVVLESITPDWPVRVLVGRILPFFLACATLDKLLICATTHPNDMGDMSAALEKYARENNERRLWVLDEPTDGNLLRMFRPGVTFYPEQWVAGRPIYSPAL
ncbi:hypothetical protein AURDEDRAFT_112592 [Auricularia subglabra TFB-10046 SS5]|nr:hypothetical protein AURDEDRAFT_112592 [Auricularia subglabra TFB-10046 SS5]